MPKANLVLDDFLPYRLSVAANAVSQVIASAYEERLELTRHEWRVVAVLAEDGELTQQGVVGRTQMDKVTVSRAAKALEKRGLLNRAPSEEDARSLILALTEEGRSLHGQLAPAALQLEKRLLAGLSGDEVEELKRLLGRVEAAAKDLLATN